MSEFLLSLADKAVNPYTKQLFTWDEEKQTLSTDWLDPSPRPERYGEKAIIPISFTK